jgi:hypothetical protein
VPAKFHRDVTRLGKIRFAEKHVSIHIMPRLSNTKNLYMHLSCEAFRNSAVIILTVFNYVSQPDTKARASIKSFRLLGLLASSRCCVKGNIYIIEKCLARIGTQKIG